MEVGLREWQIVPFGIVFTSIRPTICASCPDYPSRNTGTPLQFGEFICQGWV